MRCVSGKEIYVEIVWLGGERTICICTVRQREPDAQRWRQNWRLVTQAASISGKNDHTLKRTKMHTKTMTTTNSLENNHLEHSIKCSRHIYTHMLCKSNRTTEMFIHCGISTQIYQPQCLLISSFFFGVCWFVRLLCWSKTFSCAACDHKHKHIIFVH